MNVGRRIFQNTQIKFSITTLPEIDQRINSKYIINAGNEQHYRFIRNNRYSMFPKDNESIWIYHKPMVDICYYMLKSKKESITYITNLHYESVKRVERQDPIESEGSDELEQFMNRYELQIESSFLDNHPYLAYKKLCGYLHINGSPKDKSMFNKTAFSTFELPKDILILPYLSKLRHKFLNTAQLKLRSLDRIAKPSQTEIDEGLQEWRRIFRIKQVRSEMYVSTQEEEKYKLEWVMNHRYGESVPVSQIVEGYGEREYYARWKIQQYK